MVFLATIRTSNSLISSTLPPRLVAVFVGATSGIGETTLKKFAKYVVQPRLYFVGRSQDAADRILAECKVLNPEGKFTFMKADVSLIRVVDEICEKIREKDKVVNLLFMSQGVLSMDRSETSEHVHLLAALNYYSRIRFITNLLPLLQASTSLRRVVTVGGGSKEGPLDETDFPALRVPLPELRGHLTTLITLGLEAVAEDAPGVSFVHDYPGTVETGLYRDVGGLPASRIDVFVPIKECGERHLYLATSSSFRPLRNEGVAVPLTDGVEVALGINGEIGSGLYSVGWDCESASTDVMKLLAELREGGMVDKVRRHTEIEFERISRMDGGI
ncbi:Oxidoreductase andH [Lachnellula suecica]|uniref:Oxidoreductase andH n=1 Tax=Lachnellula suecica TaxID=602035 RepID=A0A8T9CH73_9HELO|nr:Oxidoreductase andH [Lachnellula suecica]